MLYTQEQITKLDAGFVVGNVILLGVENTGQILGSKVTHRQQKRG